MKSVDRTIFLIPVFRELDNIVIIAKSILKEHKHCLILFVATIIDEREDYDKNILKKLSQDYHNVKYIVNNKRGLGVAYKLGFCFIKNNYYDYDYVCTLDADGSHDIGKFNIIKKLGKGTDVIVASRYVHASRILKWSIFRDAGSRFVNSLLKLFLRIPISDLTSGYKLYSKEIVNKLNFSDFNSGGYVFQVESLVRANEIHATFVEIPYLFRDREKGKSKLRVYDVFEYFYILMPVIIVEFTKKILFLIKKYRWYLKILLRILELEIKNIFFDYNRPYRIIIKITDKCNFNCKTCGNWKKENKSDLDIKKIKDIFIKYNRDIYFLTITGGEPFFELDRLFEIIEIAKQECPNLYYISINTNGFYSEKISIFIKKIFAKYDFVKLYFGINYFNDENTAENKTGNLSSYKKTIETKSELALLSETHSSKLRYYSMLTVDSISDIYKLNVNKEDLWINFIEIEDFYYNKNFLIKINISILDKIKIIKQFLSQKHNISLLNRVYLSYLEKQLTKNERIRKCWAGKNRIFVDSDGKEYNCTRMVKLYDNRLNECRNCWTPCEAVFDIIQ